MKHLKNSITLDTPLRKISAFFIALITIITIIYSVNLFAILASVLLIYIAIKRITFTPWTSSTLFRIVITPFLYICLLQAVVLCVWVVNKNFPLTMTPLVLLGLLIAAMAYYFYYTKEPFVTKQPPRQGNKKITYYDILSLILAVTITGIVALGPLFTTGIGNKSSVLGLINMNVDDATHISMINDRVQFNRGVLYHTDATDNLRTYSQVTIYPTSWHAANTAIITSINKIITSGVDTIIAYIISKLFWFLLLLFFFIRSLFALYDVILNGRKTSRLAVLWIVLGGTYLAVYLLFDNFREGFYSFIPQLLAVSAVIPFLLRSNTSLGNNELKYLLPITILCICGSLAWLLTLPLFGCVILFILLSQFNFAKPKKTIVAIFKSQLPYLPLYLMLIVAAGVQLYISTRPADPSLSLSFVESINLRGPIALFPDILYYFIFIGIALFVAFSRQKNLTPFTFVFALLCISLGFTAFIYLVQSFTSGNPQYYYYKVLNIALTVAIPVTVVGFALLIQTILQNKGRQTAIYCLVLLYLSMLIFIGLNKTENPSSITSAEYVAGVRHSPGPANELTWKLATLQTQSSYMDKTFTLFYHPDPILRTNIAYTNTMILKANKPDDACFTAVLNTIIARDTNHQQTIQSISSHCTDKHTIRIIADGEDYTKLNEALNGSKNSTATILIQNSQSIMR